MTSAPIQCEQQEPAKQQLESEHAQPGDRPRTREEMLAALNRSPVEQLREQRERQQRLAQEQAHQRGLHL